MHERLERIRPALSGLKSRIISWDFQEIYQSKAPMALPLADDNAADEASGVTYKIYDSPDVLERIERIKPLTEAGRRFALDRLGVGDKAVLGMKGEEPVFYGWLMFDEIELTYGIFLPLPAGVAFAYNLHTKRSHRRQGAMSGFYHFVGRVLEQQKGSTLYVGIAKSNQGSIIAHSKSGFEKAGYFYTVKIFGTCLTLANFEHTKRFYFHCSGA